MVQFSAPQRKAYVQMLEQIRSKVENKSTYSLTQEERDRLWAKYKIAELQSKVNEEVELFQQKLDSDKHKKLSEITLSIADVWSCETADDAKKIVGKFLPWQFPDAE